MKVCYIISDIDKAVFFENTALELRKNGIELSFILINCTNKKLHFFLAEHQFEVLTMEAGSLLKTRRQIVTAKRWLKKKQVTHVHCHLAHANWIGLWASKLAGLQHRIYTRHSGEPLNIGRKERIIDKIQNRLATQIVSISQNIDDLLQKQGVSKTKRVLIHHGFDIQRFSTPDEKECQRLILQYNSMKQFPVIGVIARRMEWKGIHFVIQAFEKLLIPYPNARICLFGDPNTGDYDDQITALLANLPDENVCVIPFEYNVFDMYQILDVYVHVPINPSCEAFGQTYVEALAAKIPSVFTLSGVAREFISDRENALVVPFENSEAISKAIIEILENKELVKSITKKGYSDVSKLFDFSVYINQLIQLY